MPDLLGTWRLPDGSLFRIQETQRKRKDKIITQTLKGGTTWVTLQTLSPKHLPQLLKNIERERGVKIPYPK